MMAQAMEAVVRFLAEEAVSLGFRLPWRRGVLPLPSPESQAPSAKRRGDNRSHIPFAAGLRSPRPRTALAWLVRTALARLVWTEGEAR